MRIIWICLLVIANSCVGAASTMNSDGSSSAPGCAQLTPKLCLALALEAMGGQERLRQLKSLRLETVGHTLLTEQSYRQAPFITSYERDRTTMDLTNQRVLTEAKMTWPEDDPGKPEVEFTSVANLDSGVTRGKNGDTPCSLSRLDNVREMLALWPARILLTASDASDLHFEEPETLRSTSHTVVGFTWQKTQVRVLLNSFNHLPDAVETTQEFHDYWFFWGDVEQRIYFDNWKLFQGIPYPTNLVKERNGVIWSSVQALNVEFNVPIDANAFSMDAKVAGQSASSPGWNRPFGADSDTKLATGIDLFEGAWNSTIVMQPDGIVILEAPISQLYTQGVIEEARKRYPGAPVKAVLSTSDSWPHVGGVRFAVAQGLPVYILDLNRPLLDRLMDAPHTLDPDALEKLKTSSHPRWVLVGGKRVIGSGENRIELYPLRGASTERQYMVYFPEHRLLYASDTLVLNDNDTLYDPELMREVVAAVEREHLGVDTVFAMHQGPVEWNKVLSLLLKSTRKAMSTE
jgi:hypothetical protein